VNSDNLYLVQALERNTAAKVKFSGQRQPASTRLTKSVRVACSALFASLAAFGAAAAPIACNGICEVTVGATTLKVEPAAPSVGDDGSGFKSKAIEIFPFVLPRSGGLSTWSIGGRDLMFSESFWYRIGPANVASPAATPELHWVGPVDSLVGTTEQIDTNKARIAATTDNPPLPGGIEIRVLYDVANLPRSTVLNEKVILTNTTSQAVTLTLFAYTDLDISPSGMEDRAFGRFNGNAEVIQFDRAGYGVSVTGLGASSFDVRYLDGRIVENGGEPSILDLLNRSNLAAAFTNQSPQNMLAPGDINHVIQWTDIEIGAGQMREVALVKEAGGLSVPEPNSGLLLLAPLLGIYWSSRKRNTSRPA
jgi:hypothetical protein